jgi:D-glycero-D-manno-heptose 1,7-bisphosphate phosphatase
MTLAARPLKPAVFLDRDGVLNHVVWRGGKPASPRSAEELEIEPDAPAAVAALRADGFLLFAVTNQPDIRRELMAPADLAAIHAKLDAALSLDEIACCPHDDRDGCDCRKPKPGMLLDLARRWNIDLARSWMIGDQDRDMACARAAGCTGLLIGRDYNTGAGADHVGRGLLGLTHLILQGAKAGASI